MTIKRQCNDCGNDIPLAVSRCPHCGRPSLFPNVDVARDEQSDLQQRYNEAIEDSKLRRVIDNVSEFEVALEKSRAVINRSLRELNRLAESDNEMYATYYQLSEIRSPKGDKWDSRRQSADAHFFTNYQKEIRFASLSLDSEGLFSYGDCSIILKEEMIAHRASLCDENTVLFMRKHNVLEADDIPKGYRAIWADRIKLCIAKLAKKIDNRTNSDEYSKLLLHQGINEKGEFDSSKDEYVEVHIFGPMTVRTIEEVTFKPVKKKAEKAIIKSIKEKLTKFGVKINK